MPAKIAKTTRYGCNGVKLCHTIREFKNVLGLPYSTVAGWMGITTSNLTSMVSQGLNPYPKQWDAFLVGVQNHNTKKRRAWISVTKIAICAYRNCDETIILWAHNKKYCCPNHGKLERRMK